LGTPLRAGGCAIAAAAHQTADTLDRGTDGDRAAEYGEQSDPGLVFEGLTADAADEERVQRPDDGGYRGRDDEPSARVAGEPAGEGHRGAAAGDEAAGNDELHAEPSE